MAGRLEGKVCVVTGASGGIGSATVEAFQREGAKVAGVDLHEDAPGDLSLAVDVTEEFAVEQMYAQIREEFGAIHVLFNNAGISPTDDDSVLKTGLDAWQRVQDVNLKSVFLCCRFGIPHRSPDVDLSRHRLRHGRFRDHHGRVVDFGGALAGVVLGRGN